MQIQVLQKQIKKKKKEKLLLVIIMHLSNQARQYTVHTKTFRKRKQENSGLINLQNPVPFRQKKLLCIPSQPCDI